MDTTAGMNKGEDKQIHYMPQNIAVCGGLDFKVPDGFYSPGHSVASHSVNIPFLLNVLSHH